LNDEDVLSLDKEFINQIQIFTSSLTISKRGLDKVHKSPSAIEADSLSASGDLDPLGESAILFSKFLFQKINNK